MPNDKAAHSYRVEGRPLRRLVVDHRARTQRRVLSGETIGSGRTERPRSHCDDAGHRRSEGRLARGRRDPTGGRRRASQAPPRLCSNSERSDRCSRSGCEDVKPRSCSARKASPFATSASSSACHTSASARSSPANTRRPRRAQSDDDPTQSSHCNNAWYIVTHSWHPRRHPRNRPASTTPDVRGKWL